MILVDTSAWIDYFNEVDSPAAALVDQALLTGQTVVGDLVLVEVLQGVRHSKDLRRFSDTFSSLLRRSLCGPEIAELAAANYRFLRRQGITIRGTIDVIIATWCVTNDAEIIHNDRDLAAMERLLGVRAFR